jgi:trigger factor
LVMATITRENIKPLHDKLMVKMEKEDYLPSYEKKMKSLSKSANMPGFRKGMVPTGLMKKMYGRDIMIEEIQNALNEKLESYMKEEKLRLIGQPIVVEELKVESLDVNKPTDQEFTFEIGLQPKVNIDVKNIQVTRYVLNVSEEYIDDSVKGWQERKSKRIDLDVIGSNKDEYTTIDTTFKETDIDGNDIENGFDTSINHLALKEFTDAAFELLKGKIKDDTVVVQLKQVFEGENLKSILEDIGYSSADTNKEEAAKIFAANEESPEKFAKITINKIEQLEKVPLDETFFEAAYPNQEIKTEEAFRAKIKEEYDAMYKKKSSEQLKDQIFHYLIDHTEVELPKDFIIRWMQTGNKEQKSAEELEKDYPAFAKQLKWGCIAAKLDRDFGIMVTKDDFKSYVVRRLSSLFGGRSFNENEDWVDGYTEKMLKDERYLNEAYIDIRDGKIFSRLEDMVQAKEENIDDKAFFEMLRRHNHEHHDHEHGHEHKHEDNHEHEHNHEH